jgi:Uma2 family endonuclease
MTLIASEPTGTELGRIDLHIPPDMRLDDDLLFAFCEANRELRIERNAQGDLEIMPPTGAETGARNSDLNLDFGIWARADGRGVVFDSSTGFLLPNGAMRSPDLAWVLRERLATMRPKQKRTFLRLVPDLVIELASPTDDSDGLHAKMREWRDNGVRLGWLILPEQRQVWLYAQGVEPVCLDNPAQIGDEALLPSLALPLDRIWEPGL